MVQLIQHLKDRVMNSRVSGQSSIGLYRYYVQMLCYGLYRYYVQMLCYVMSVGLFVTRGSMEAMFKCYRGILMS